MHIKEKNKLITISSNDSSISSFKFNKNIIPIKILSKASYACEICEDKIPKEEAIKNECQNCNKFYCDECLYLYFKESIKNGKCELFCSLCKIMYDENKVKDIISSKYGTEEEKNNLLCLYEKNKLKNQILSNPNLMFCPIPDCKGYATKNNSSNYNICNKGHKFCVRCGEI